MNKREKIAFAIVVTLAMTGSGFAYGQSVNNVSNGQTIYACVTGINGNLVRVSNTEKTCPRGTTPISWNTVGPQGAQGIPGTAAAKGDKGDQGIPGPKGDKGENGLSAIGGSSNTYFVFENTGLKKPVVLGGMVPIGSQAFLIDQNGKLFSQAVSPILFAQPGCSGFVYGGTGGVGSGVAVVEFGGERLFGTYNTNQDWKQLKSVWLPKPSTVLWQALYNLFGTEPDWDKDFDLYAPDPGYNVGLGGRCVSIDMEKLQQLFLYHYSTSARMEFEARISLKELKEIGPLPSLGPWHYEFLED
jgi:hypothetical protein